MITIDLGRTQPTYVVSPLWVFEYLPENSGSAHRCWRTADFLKAGAEAPEAREAIAREAIVLCTCDAPTRCDCVCVEDRCAGCPNLACDLSRPPGARWAASRDRWGLAHDDNEDGLFDDDLEIMY